LAVPLSAQTSYDVFPAGSRPPLTLSAGLDLFEAICGVNEPSFRGAGGRLRAMGALSPPDRDYIYELPGSETSFYITKNFAFVDGTSPLTCSLTFGTDTPRHAFFAEIVARYGPRRETGAFFYPAGNKMIFIQATVEINGMFVHQIYSEDSALLSLVPAPVSQEALL